MSAAAQAADQGLKALVIEKGRSTGGSGNYVEGVFAVDSKMQREQGIEINQAELLHDEQEYSHYKANTKIWREYIKQSAANIDWLKAKGVQFDNVATLGSGIDTWHLFSGLGNKAIHAGLEPFAREHGVEIIKSATVTDLVIGKDKQVTGVKVQDFESNTVATIMAKAVIIATGGYLNNQKMLAKYFNENANRIVPVNSGKNTGDGLTMAWKAGAKQFGLGMAMMFGGQIKESAVPSYQYWKSDLGIASAEQAPLWVNEIGERFVKENVFDNWAHAGNAIIRQERVYAILDQGIIDKFTNGSLPRSLKPLSTKTKLANLPKMLTEAVDKKRSFITKADSVAELANQIDLPELATTVKAYNHACEQGQDLDFEKPVQYLTSVSQAPFYAIELGVGAYCTMGGLRVNERNEVLDANGRKLAGLYAVGNDAAAVLVGNTYGVNVPGSEAGYCVYSGRVAVQMAEKYLS
ncbi:FAD-binding protein [Lactobacillus sp. ESL0684]|nr:FAD-binding protein [Lactobacillus sp. ESL0684]